MPASRAARRLVRLQALEVRPLRLRGTQSPVQGHAPARDQPATSGNADARQVACVLLLPAACPQRCLALVDRAMLALGDAFAHAPRVWLGDAGLQPSPPAAQVYLAFGDAQARALGHALTLAEIREAEVVLLDPPDSLHEAAAKQRLWQALRPVRLRFLGHPGAGGR